MIQSNRGEQYFRRDVQQNSVVVSQAISDLWDEVEGQDPPRAITVETPGSAERILFGHIEREFTLDSLVAVVVGTTPSVTWSLRYDADASATGTEVVVGGTTTTNTTSGDRVTALDNPVIPADVFLWLATTATSGTVASFNLTLLFS